MPEKKPDTPNGLICKVCGRDLPLYNFFKFAGTYDRTFWVNFPPLELQNHICFECAAPYRCIECGEIKGASEFRIQGQVCKTCKSKHSQRSRMPLRVKR